MNKIRIFSVLLICALTFIMVGCGGGGGGSSTPVEKDVAGITGTLNGLLAAIKSGDQAAVTRIFPATAGSPSSSVYTLIVKDLGDNIADKSDDKPYEFYIYEQDIVQPSENVAFVKAAYPLSGGGHLVIKFSLIRESGLWVISDMEPSSTEPSDDSTHEQMVAQTYFPLQYGMTKIFSIETPGDGGSVLDDRTMSSVSSGEVYNGITFYEMTDDTIASDYPGFDGVPVSPNLKAATQKTAKRSLRKTRRASLPVFDDASSIYFGFDASGALWCKSPDIGDGVPFLFFEANSAFGSSRTINLSWLDPNQQPVSGTMSLLVGSPIVFATPLRSYSGVVPITFILTVPWMGSTLQSKEVIYLAPGVGIIGSDIYDSAADTEPAEIERMITRFSSDLTLNERNDPMITSASDLGTYARGETVNTVDLAATGGTAPYIYSLYVSGSTPDFFLSGVSLSSSGRISGYVAGNPADGPYYTNVVVTDKYGRHTYKSFSMTVESVPGVSFYPAFNPSGESITGVSKDWAILVDGQPVEYSNFSDLYYWSFENVSPANAYSSDTPSSNKIGIGSYMINDAYYGKAGFWAMSYPGTTVSFELVLERISDGAIFRSGILSYTSP
jgi:hypothetical protein